jgi:hypothetical protein
MPIDPLTIQAEISDKATKENLVRWQDTLNFMVGGGKWDDLRIASSSVRLGSSAPNLTASFAGNANLYTIQFANTGTEIVYFDIQMPHAWETGTTVYPHVHFSPITTGTGTVQFILEYTWANINGTFGGSSTCTMTNVISSNSQWNHLLATNSTGISGSGKGISSMLVCRLYRDNTVGGNLAANVSFLEFDRILSGQPKKHRSNKEFTWVLTLGHIVLQMELSRMVISL